MDRGGGEAKVSTRGGRGEGGGVEILAHGQARLQLAHSLDHLMRVHRLPDLRPPEWL